jgi:hypothetical protein
MVLDAREVGALVRLSLRLRPLAGVLRADGRNRATAGEAS